MITCVANYWSRTVRRFGIASFLFFLVKGILWLAAPWVLAWVV